ncbi:MAG: hypothetical protein WCL49_12155 [bacterium]|jgi:hypothetical protein
MDESLLAELRHRAVDAHMSLSAWITATLKSMAPPACELDEIRGKAIKRMETGFHLGNTPMSRDELHVR